MKNVYDIEKRSFDAMKYLQDGKIESEEDQLYQNNKKYKSNRANLLKF